MSLCPPIPAPPDPRPPNVRALIGCGLGLPAEELSLRVSLAQLGVETLDLFELIEGLELALGVKIPGAQIWEMYRIADIEAAVQIALAASAPRGPTSRSRPRAAA